MTSKLERHAEQLSALGHPVRLQILRFVVQAGSTGAAAGDIQSHVDLPASTLSHHLKALRTAGVIDHRKDGTRCFVSLRPDHPALVARDGDDILDSFIFAGAHGLISGVWRAGARLVTDGEHRERAAVAARYGRTLERLLAS